MPAADDVFHSSPKTHNFCASSTVFIFTFFTCLQVSNFSCTTKGKPIKPYSECLKKKAALTDLIMNLYFCGCTGSIISL